ncbi:MAG TPA: hypothetical protein VM841_05310 [Actinomycetota bacterium]|nr:hypothetical protein [Actinomycetota bacterium]
MTKTRWIALISTTLLVGGCGSGADGGDGKVASQVGERATISHIHGLGVDAHGTLFVATHDGLIKQGADGSFVYASADTNDHMGFSLHPGDGVMYRSGHSPAKPSLGVQTSTDGARWMHVSDVADPPVDFHAMAVSFADSKTLWGWDSSGRGTFRSNDGGATWARLQSHGLEPQVYVLAGSAAPKVVYAGTASGLHRSSDGGATWERIVSGGWAIGVATDPKDPNRMLVSTQSGVKATSDGGDTWSDAGGGLPPSVEIAYLTISAADGNVAYAADSSKIYKTTDGGTSWTRVPTDPSDPGP